MDGWMDGWMNDPAAIDPLLQAPTHKPHHPPPTQPPTTTRPSQHVTQTLTKTSLTPTTITQHPTPQHTPLTGACSNPPPSHYHNTHPTHTDRRMWHVVGSLCGSDVTWGIAAQLMRTLGASRVEVEGEESLRLGMPEGPRYVRECV
jgi:hypothetical protein